MLLKVGLHISGKLLSSLHYMKSFVLGING